MSVAAPTRLSIATLLALAACHRAPARIYSDAEIARLEEQVLAKVAETDTSCSHQELLDFADALDEPCHRASWDLLKNRRAGDPAINVDSNEVAAVDELCGAKILAAFGRAAATSPGCSPFQVGVRTVPGTFAGDDDPLLRYLQTTFILEWHALRETDPYVGLTELLVGVRVYQDLARGRIDMLQDTDARGMEEMLLRSAEKILKRSSLTKDQLGDVGAMLDTTIENEPRFGEALQGDAVKLALHYGLATLKPADWQPPGGRDKNTMPRKRAPKSAHDPRDDAAQTMATGLRVAELFAQQCPPAASLASCYANLTRDAVDARPSGLDATDKQASRVALYPDDNTRHDSQQQLLAANAETRQAYAGHRVQERTELVAHLIAVRLHVQILRDGKCPSEAQLREPPYSTLSAPGVLGDSLPVHVNTDSISVDVPAWAREQKIKMPSGPPWPPALPKFKAVDVPCPPPP